MTRERAEVLALKALGFIASDDDLFCRFLNLTGMDIDRLKATADEIGTSLAALEFLMYDDRLVVAFAKSAGIKPDEVMQINLALAGPELDLE